MSIRSCDSRLRLEYKQARRQHRRNLRRRQQTLAWARLVAVMNAWRDVQVNRPADFPELMMVSRRSEPFEDDARYRYWLYEELRGWFPELQGLAQWGERDWLFVEIALL